MAGFPVKKLRQPCGNTLTCWTYEALLHLAEAKLGAVCARRTGQDALDTATKTVVSSWTVLGIFS